jgi:sulfhydrogenase subunit beta (sulfur reductase)
MAEAAVEAAAGRMGRALETDQLKQILYDNFEHPQWDEVSKRCLACTNCTLVCPTCFCSTVEDTTDLTGAHAERWRRWDSCFTLEYARVAGGNTRPSVRARYRQWLMHKLGYWIDQFGVSGCVGCGRCITWCPVGIDITAEATAIRGERTAVSMGASGQPLS